jgi:hypothetical protein
MNRLKVLASVAALFMALVGGTVPWARLLVRGHVEFCAGECNPPDWFDHAENLGYLLSLGIPIVAMCFGVKRLAMDRACNWKVVLTWGFVLACAVGSCLRLAALREAYFAQF